MTNREHLKQLRAQLTAARSEILIGNCVTGADRNHKLLAGRLIREQLQEGKTAAERRFSLPAEIAEAEAEPPAAAPLADAGGWPYSESSRLIDRDLAASIRQWALTEGANGQPMAEAELHSYSQRQLLQMYVDHLAKVLERVRPEMADPARRAWAA
jgi:hypothetical protein